MCYVIPILSPFLFIQSLYASFFKIHRIFYLLVICTDDTHGTNSYDFNLITVVVVDEFGEGYPVAWCLCNRVDMYVLIDFLMAIKEKVHPIRPHWVMTDDAEQYFNAWIAVFGMGPKKTSLYVAH